MIACTTPSTRAFFEEGLESLIGSFSRAIIDGLSSPRGTVPDGNEITVESLFRFAREETKRRTGDKQEPYMQGDLTETLSIYLPRPEIIPGITGEISRKCGYSKLPATVLTIGKRRFDNIRILYQIITAKHRDEFLTNSRDERGHPKLANWTALRRYLDFLRTIQVVDKDELMLTVRGLISHEYISKHYNLDKNQKRHLRYEALSGNEIVDGTARVCVMNLYLHGIGGDE